jgi:F-type H+-transporting ATPase subunit epsilon
MSGLPTSLELSVATPLGLQISTTTDSVQVPSQAGELGILPGHLPVLAALRPGILTYNDKGMKVRAAIGGGFAEGDASHVRVITEFFQKAEDVNLEKAQADLAAADARLKGLKGTIDDIEHIEAKRDYDWATARIELAKGAHN